MYSLSFYVVFTSGLLVFFYGYSSYQPVSTPKTWQANIKELEQGLSKRTPPNFSLRPFHLYFILNSLKIQEWLLFKGPWQNLLTILLR